MTSTLATDSATAFCRLPLSFPHTGSTLWLGGGGGLTKLFVYEALALNYGAALATI